MKEIFDQVIETIENEDIKQFMVEKCMPIINPYFWEVPASSSHKYHPSYAITEPLGLAKHTVALVRILNHMFAVESVGSQFTSRERDLLRVAGLMHDTFKSGTQEDYEKNKYTKFDHPMIAAKAVWNLDGLPEDEKKLLCNAIAAHMGQFNTSSRAPGITLPTPQNKYQIILHLADYLASRKDIEILFDNNNVPAAQETPPDINTWVLPFGKFKGLTLPEVNKQAPWYIKWAKENANTEPLKSLVQQI